MSNDWSEICTIFRSVFCDQLKPAHTEGFLDRLHPVYQAALALPELAPSEAPWAGEYRAALQQLLGEPINSLVPISLGAYDASPLIWRQKIHANVMAKQEPLKGVIKIGFDSELYKKRQAPVIAKVMETEISQIANTRARLVRSFFRNNLGIMFGTLPHIRSTAAHVLLSTYLWAGSADDADLIADLSAFFPYLFQMPPIGRPAWEPDNYLVLVR